MTSWDVITPTSIGTGVAKTSLGTITKPEEVQSLIEFVPYYAPSGVVTAGESMLLETALESNSVNLLPKRIINPVIQAGLGATFATMIPMLEAWNCNTPLQAGATPSIQQLLLWESHFIGVTPNQIIQKCFTTNQITKQAQEQQLQQ